MFELGWRDSVWPSDFQPRIIGGTVTYNVAHEAQATTNELLYRNGALEPLYPHTADVGYITEVLERVLQEAFDAGRKSESK